MTKQHAETIYSKLYKHLLRELAGGLSYGMDWSTVRVLYPQHARVMRECLDVINGEGK